MTRAGSSRPDDYSDPGSPVERVLLVSHYLPPHVGGIENVVRAEADQLAAAGQRVTALSTAVGGPSNPEYHDVPAPLDGPGAPARTVRLPAWNTVERWTGVPFPLPAPRSVLTVLRLVGDSDVVHVHDLLYATTWMAALAARLLRRRLVLTQHVHLVAHPNALVRAVQHIVYATAGRLIVAQAERIAYLNGQVRDFLLALGADEDDLVFLPNAVDRTRFRPARPGEQSALRRRLFLPPERPLVLFVGRFVPKKGYPKVVAARSGAYTLVLVGGGGSPTDDPGLIDLGSRTPDQVAELYRACDVFVLPSEAEGFPMTIQEAMASGLPVVTTDDPGYAPYGLDRDQVVLLSPEDDLRSVLEDLVARPDCRAAMGSYALRYAERVFDPNEHLAGLRRLYGHRDAPTPPAVRVSTTGKRR